jgi:hypothetical protein
MKFPRLGHAYSAPSSASCTALPAPMMGSDATLLPATTHRTPSTRHSRTEMASRGRRMADRVCSLKRASSSRAASVLPGALEDP